jgi:transcriptional regulator with XRE-family HTH domain
MSQQQLAKKMNTSQQTIARWEAGKAALNVNHIKDLCLVLECSAEELLGWSAEPEEIRESPFANSNVGIPYGTLRLVMTFGEREYPIDENARSSLLKQIEALGVMDDRMNEAWIYAWTLNNKTLLINPRHLVKIELISDDVVEMPDYLNAEIYRSLEQWPHEELGKNMGDKCEQLTEELGEEAIDRLISYVRTTYKTGNDDWSLLDKDVATEWFKAVAQWFSLKQSSFIQIKKEGFYQVSFANLGQIATVEIPTCLYGRLTMPA